jgi:NAD(P)-dependent dehydrogenase (short-subunit alcohol dehydrogenase family)
MTRRAVVTGGTGGIGFHVARPLHEHGFTVTVVGRDPDRGADTVRRIGGRWGRAWRRRARCSCW